MNNYKNAEELVSVIDRRIIIAGKGKEKKIQRLKDGILRQSLQHYQSCSLYGKQK